MMLQRVAQHVGAGNRVTHVAAAAPLPALVVPLQTDDDALAVVGGKGRSLSRMSRASFRVPGGFIATTAAYRGFVAENGLQARLLELATPEVKDGMLSFEAASRRISALFAAAPPSRAIAAEIARAYAGLGDAQGC